MKLIKRLVLVLVLLFVLLALGAGLFLDSILKRAIEAGGSAATGVATTLEGVDASLFSGSFGLQGLSLANPPGFSSAPFLACKELRASWQNGTILSDPLVIDEFELDGLALSLERNAAGGNWEKLLEKTDSGPGGKPAPPQGGESAPGRSVTIQRIDISNVEAALHVAGLPALNGDWKVKVPAIHLEQLRSNGSAAEIAGVLMRAVVEAVLREAAASGQGVFPADVLKDLQGGLKSIGKELQNQLEKSLQGQGGDLKGGLKEAEKGLKDLFGGKKK